MEIEIYNIKTHLTKEFITNESKINDLLNQINDLEKLTFDFSSKEKVKEAKALKTQANKFIEKLKELCEPLEAEGKRISDARSKISTTLISGKNNVIDRILKPVNEAEDKLKYIKAKINNPILDLISVSNILTECSNLCDFNWLYLKEDAEEAINSLKGKALVAKETLEAEQKLKLEVEQKAREQREAQIAIEAAEKAKKEAENQIKEAELRAINAEKVAKEQIEAERLKIENQKKLELEEIKRRESDRDHKIKVNNEILLAMTLITEKESESEDKLKVIIKAIVKGEIPHVYIKY
jgi:hypothetical protein